MTLDPVANAAQGRSRWPLVLVSVLVITIVGIGVTWMIAFGPGQQQVSPPGSDITQFSGDGDQTTGSFTVRGQWQVHWQNSGDQFTFAIKGDQDLGIVIDQSEPGSGVSSIVAAGRFHLEITANGPWEIQITQGE